MTDWPDAKRLADRKLYTMPEHPRIPLRQVVPRASSEAIKLMEWMLNYNPRNRPKPNQVLAHAFFHIYVVTHTYESKFTILAFLI